MTTFPYLFMAFWLKKSDRRTLTYYFCRSFRVKVLPSLGRYRSMDPMKISLDFHGQMDLRSDFFCLQHPQPRLPVYIGRAFPRRKSLDRDKTRPIGKYGLILRSKRPTNLLNFNSRVEYNIIGYRTPQEEENSSYSRNKKKKGNIELIKTLF